MAALTTIEPAEEAAMIYSGAGPLPRHRYCYVEPDTFGNSGWERVAWFGLVSHPGRTWGCHVMLECGAIYRNVPLHRLSHQPTMPKWEPKDAQVWDCYGHQFSVVEYPFLESAGPMKVRLLSGVEMMGKYLFTAIPMLDGYSLDPEQSKEFMFVALENGRFCSVPTNHVLVNDKSFIRSLEWPRLKRQTEVWSVD
jgi:hypothetical protein